MKNIVNTEPDPEKQKDKSFKKSFIEKLFFIIGLILDFILGCFVSLLGLGILYVILYGLSCIGVARTITEMIWIAGCVAGVAISGLGLITTLVMIRENTSHPTMPVLWFAISLAPGIFLFRVMRVLMFT